MDVGLKKGMINRAEAVNATNRNNIICQVL